jgi:hypothetical protein
MYAKYVTGNTVLDLGSELPYKPNYVVAALNPTASSVTLQFSDASTGPFVTGKTRSGAAAVIPAGGAIEAVIGGRYAAIENGTGQIQLVSD